MDKNKNELIESIKLALSAAIETWGCCLIAEGYSSEDMDKVVYGLKFVKSDHSEKIDKLVNEFMNSLGM